MIKLNADKKEKYTLVAIYDTCKNIPEMVCKTKGKVSFIAEEDKFYMYFKNCGNLCYPELTNQLMSFFKTNKHSMNVDVCSFNNKGGSQTLQVITEAILYATHKQYSLKTTKKAKTTDTNNVVYNLMCDGKCEIPKYAEVTCEADCTRDTTRNAEWCAKLIEQTKIKMKYVNFARDLQDMPPNKCYSTAMADMIVQQADKIKGLKVTVLDKKAIIENKMNLVLAVNNGSKYDPRVVILEYNGNPNSNEKLGLVGKGVTFDTGGYNLKPSMFMKGMKFDMSGAAIATSAIMAIAEAGLKVNYTAVACLVDNAVDAKATIPESIITSMNGKTVQIDNTDAEGRLILADGITYSIRKLGVTRIVEMSTLTGAILIALGTKITGVYASNEKLFNTLKIGAIAAIEDIWRMPLHCDFDEMMKKTPIADLTNVGATRWGGANQAAAFLKQFTENKPFIHLDIAGTATTEDQRGRGVMVRTLFSMAKIVEYIEKTNYKM